MKTRTQPTQWTLGRVASLMIAIAVSSLFTTVSAAPQEYEDEVMDANPFLYYRLNETEGTTASDSSGFNRDGTYANSPTLGVTGAGPDSDNAVTFNGSDQRVETSGASTFGSSLVTSSFEFIFSTTNSSSAQALFGVFNDFDETSAVVTFNENAAGSSSSNSMRFWLRNASGSHFGVAIQNEAMSDGNFHHLVFTYDQNDASVKGYLNGVEQTFSSTINSPGVDGFTNFDFDPSFAARNLRGAHDQHFEGTLDEAVLYDSVLSAEDVQRHFGAIPEPGTMVLMLTGALLMLMRRRFFN